MKDSHKEIRTAYFQAINGNVSIVDADGVIKVVPIYDNVPSAAEYPFILFDSFDISDASVKDQYLQNTKMFLTVFTRYDSSYGGSAITDDITNLLMQLLLVNPNSYISTSNFRVITTKLESRISDKAVINGYKIYLSQLVISHVIEQITESTPPIITCADATVNINGNLFDTVISGGIIDIPVLNGNNDEVGSSSFGNFIIGNSIFNINNVGVATVNAETTANVNVVNSDNTQVGSNFHGNWLLPNENYDIYLDGVFQQTVSVTTLGTENITINIL